MEMLIVVIIAAAVVVMSVPSYKKARDRVRFDEAKGLLIDLGMAVQSLQSDLAMGGKEYPASQTTLTPSMQNGTTNSDDSVVELASRADGQTLLGYALFEREYLPKIQFSGSTYKGYTFYICPASGGSGVCASYNGIRCVVAMQDTSANENYRWGRYLEDTSIIRGE